MPPRTTDRPRFGRSFGATVIGVSVGVSALLAVVAVASGVLAVDPVAALARAAPPPDTVNEFIPENRNLGDCLGALQRPGCGSEASGGWRQGLIFLAMLGGLIVIATRIVVSTRRRRATAD